MTVRRLLLTAHKIILCLAVSLCASLCMYNTSEMRFGDCTKKFQLALYVLKEGFQRNVLHFKCFKMLNFNIMCHCNCPYPSCNQTHDHINSVIEKFKKKN